MAGSFVRHFRPVHAKKKPSQLGSRDVQTLGISVRSGSPDARNYQDNDIVLSACDGILINTNVFQTILRNNKTY
jgi:hypothetical protein